MPAFHKKSESMKKDPFNPEDSMIQRFLELSRKALYFLVTASLGGASVSEQTCLLMRIKHDFLKEIGGIKWDPEIKWAIRWPGICV